VNVENPPVIEASGTTPGYTTSTVTWTTNTPASSIVNYGLTTAYGSSTTSSSLVTNHPMTLSGLQSGTLYHFQISSVDAQGNPVTSLDMTFTTGGIGFTVGVGGLTAISYNGQSYFQKNGLNDGNITFVASGTSNVTLFNILSNLSQSYSSDNQTYVQTVYNNGQADSLTIKNVFSSADGKTLQVDTYITDNASSDTLATTNFNLFPLTLPATATQATYSTDDLNPQDARFSRPVGFLSNTWGSVAFLMNDYADANSNLSYGYATSTNLLNVYLRTYSIDHNNNTFGAPITPGQTLHLTNFLRFGTASDTATSLAPEPYNTLRGLYPYLITNWPDRRPIAYYYFSNGVNQNNPNNPRNYLSSSTMNITNQSAFNAAILASASATIAILNAQVPRPQGVIAWDLEGEAFNGVGGITYVGDPTRLPTLAPDMNAVADQFFQMFKNAGYKVGMTLRPETFGEGTVVPPSCVYSSDYNINQTFIQDSTSSPWEATGWTCSASSTYVLGGGDQNNVTNASNTAAVDNAALIANLESKIRYARNRWGAKLFYVDSDWDGSYAPDFTIWRTLQQEFPDTLFFPEHAANSLTWGATAPYGSTAENGVTTPQGARDVYPQAFSLRVTPSPSSTYYTSILQPEVASGSILMYQGWYSNSGQVYTNSIYAADGLTSNPVDTTPPSVPAGITATPTSTTSVVLSWTASSDDFSVDGYQVFRNGTQITTTTESNYTDTGLSSGTTYHYTLTAFDAAGNTSAQSSDTPATTSGAVPTAPQSLSASSGNTHVSLSWSAPSSDGGSSLTQYLVYDRFTGSSTFVLYATTTFSQTTSTVFSLMNGQAYDFEILAQNSVGTSTPSNVATSTPITVPTAPLNATSTPGNGFATVSVSTPASDGGSAIFLYTASSTDSNNVLVTSTNRFISVPNLTNATPYTFVVFATNLAGNSPNSSSTTVTPVNTSTAPSAPQSLTAIPGNQQIALSWSTPSSDGGSSLTGYQVYDRFTGSSTFVLYATTTQSQTTSTVASLTNGQAYDVQVLAVNAIGTSSRAFQSDLVPFTVPDVPISLSASAGNAEATVSFSPGSNGGSTILFYTATSDPSNISATSTGSPVVVPGLVNGQAYTFTVTATNAAGPSAASSPSNAVIPNALAPVISSFTASPASITSGAPSTLSWVTTGATTVSLDNGIGSEAATSTGSVVVSPTSTTIYTFTAVNSNGTSTAQATVSVAANNATTSAPASVVVNVGGGYGVPYIPGVGPIATTTPFSTPPVTSSMSNADLQELINSLTARLNILLAQARTQNPTITFAFTRDLQLRDTGNDVQMLQQFLNTKGFLVSQTGPGSPGNETTYFGVKTWQALVRFQKSVGIKPASGYFGPITQAWVNNLIP
jgi:hypothetical protein